VSIGLTEQEIRARLGPPDYVSGAVGARQYHPAGTRGLVYSSGKPLTGLDDIMVVLDESGHVVSAVWRWLVQTPESRPTCAGPESAPGRGRSAPAR